MEVNVNATLFDAPRALAATAAAFALPLVIALIAPAAIGTVQERLGDHQASVSAPARTSVTTSPTWARTPLEALRRPLR
jgi:hypothetical protein